MCHLRLHAHSTCEVTEAKLDCAGAKEGGQKLLQCLDVRVSRNFFGAQICCFEQQLPAHELLRRFGEDPTYRAVFIRAPAILAANKEHVTVLSEYKLSEEEQAKAGQTSVIVAAKSGNMLATAFHPELTEDLRWCVTTSCTHNVSALQAVRSSALDRETVLTGWHDPSLRCMALCTSSCCIVHFLQTQVCSVFNMAMLNIVQHRRGDAVRHAWLLLNLKLEIPPVCCLWHDVACQRAAVTFCLCCKTACSVESVHMQHSS